MTISPDSATSSVGEDVAQRIRIAIYDWSLGLADDRLAVLTNKDIQRLADLVIAAVKEADGTTT